MKWDLAFYLRNLPCDYRVEDIHFAMLDVTDAHVEILLKGTTDMPEVQEFFNRSREEKISVVTFQLEAGNAGDAMTLGEHQLGGLIDGMAPLLDRNLPEVCTLAEVRMDEDRDTILMRRGTPGWAYFNPQDPATAAAWKERQHKVFLELMPFYDIATGIHAHKDTSLSRQLLYSMKMYRAGAETEDFGLEFISKWSGLEGLVCGGETSNKGNLVRTRLPQLQPSPIKDVVGVVSDLWKYRNGAVHEALAFQSDHLDEAPPLAIWVEPVERLFLAVVVFALAHLDKADSVRTLWPHVATFTVPDHVASERPKDMGRWPVTKVRFDTNRGVTGGGLLFDRLRAYRLEKRGQQNSSPPP